MTFGSRCDIGTAIELDRFQGASGHRAGSRLERWNDTMDARASIWSMLTSAARSLVRRSGTTVRQVRSGRPASGPVADWTDAELYKVWCATSTELLKAVHAERSDRTMTAADARRYLLAEIERRHPRATATWLASDAILTGEPPRFLLRQR